MAGQDFASVTAILKEVYGPRVENQLQNEIVALKRIERTSDGVTETVGGKYVDFPIKVGRNNGLGYRAEMGALPTAGKQSYQEVHVPLRYGYGRVQFTGQLMQLVKTNTQAFVNSMDDEMEGLKDDIAKDSARIAYGDGIGHLAAVTADGANTVTVDNVQYLDVGMKIDIALTASPYTVLASGRLITAINEGTKVVTYDGADAAADATYSLYRTGSAGLEPSGFGVIVDDAATLHGLAVATEAKWASVIDANGGVNRALSESLMIKLCDNIRRKGGKVTVIFTSLGVRRAYFNLLTQQRRYADTKEFAGGFSGLAFNYGTEIPVVEDVDCQPNRMVFLNEKELKIYQSKDWHWADEDGNVLKNVVGYDAFEAFMRKYWEIGTSRRNSHGQLKDITEG